MIRSRSKPRPGRLTGEALERLREECFDRDDGICQRCGKPILHFQARFDGDPEAYDMAHKRNRRMWGDTLANVQAEHHKCHMLHHAGGKPCPPKGRP